MTSQIINLFALVVISVHVAESRMCFSCMFQGCGDPFSPGALGVYNDTCNGSCYKFIWGQQITRTCSPELMEDGCRKTDVNGNVGHVCYCNSDYCNAGSDVTLPLLVLISSVMTSQFAIRKCT